MRAGQLVCPLFNDGLKLEQLSAGRKEKARLVRLHHIDSRLRLFTGRFTGSLCLRFFTGADELFVLIISLRGRTLLFCRRRSSHR